MRWPPNKAWTSICLYKGFRHFVAINYGGAQEKKWVNMVSVIDAGIRLRVDWYELRDSSKWITGWHQIPLGDKNNINNSIDLLDKEETNFFNTCLHPSDDSGLLIPTEKNNIRPWF